MGEGTWERHRPGGTIPLARHGHSFTVVGGGRRLVLYGGLGESGGLLNDVQVFYSSGGTRLIRVFSMAVESLNSRPTHAGATAAFVRGD